MLKFLSFVTINLVRGKFRLKDGNPSIINISIDDGVWAEKAKKKQLTNSSPIAVKDIFKEFVHVDRNLLKVLYYAALFITLRVKARNKAP